MTKSWQHCKNILIIRADNMGDLIMSVPAIRALKDTFSSKITVLTSSMAKGVVPFIPEIDEVIIFDLPWVKAKETDSKEIFSVIKLLEEKQFDAVVIFTVFSQNPLPAAMIAYMAGIPLRLAYCRENPYGLLTDWVPDKEPYTFIQHQVERDLSLVKQVGASTDDRNLRLTVTADATKNAIEKIKTSGVYPLKKWLIFHAGVSEKKREYPKESWIKAAQELIRWKGFQIVFTGAASEKMLCDSLAEESGEGAFSVAGQLTLEEFIALVKQAAAVVSVNTGTVHIAAAVNTPIVVLYAQTNPQHTPWMVRNKVLEFVVEEDGRSKNEVIQYLYKQVYTEDISYPKSDDIINAVMQLLDEQNISLP